MKCVFRHPNAVWSARRAREWNGQQLFITPSGECCPYPHPGPAGPCLHHGLSEKPCKRRLVPLKDIGTERENGQNTLSPPSGYRDCGQKPDKTGLVPLPTPGTSGRNATKETKSSDQTYGLRSKTRQNGLSPSRLRGATHAGVLKLYAALLAKEGQRTLEY